MMLYVEWCDLGCKQVGLKSFVILIDYRDYMGSSSKIWALQCLFLYLCSYNLVGSVTVIVLFQNPLQHLFSSHKLLRRQMTKMKMDAVIFRLVIWHIDKMFHLGKDMQLLAHRNTMFERRISQNTWVSINDGEDHADESTMLPQSTVTNNGK
jgi:hypothetical protein